MISTLLPIAGAQAASTASKPAPLLELDNLSINFSTPLGIAQVVNGVSLSVGSGEFHGLVGESGSGKSVTARSILGLTPRKSLAARSGRILYAGRDLLLLTEDQMRTEIRGSQISMVFQDPMTALNPVMQIGDQLALPMRQHKGLSKAQALERAVELLDQVGIPNPRQRIHSYPSEMSGGQRQRVMIAIALSCDPQLLIADEPTTALDVTVQAQILDLFDRLRKERGLAVLMVSHDLALIAERCDRVSTMYAGRVVESGSALPMFSSPLHPYTHLLEEARPYLDNAPHTPLKTIPGRPPRLVDLPPGCAFASRCPRVVARCRLENPVLRTASEDRFVACFNPHPSVEELEAVKHVDNTAVGTQAVGTQPPGLSDTPVLVANQIVVDYRLKGGGSFRAVDGVTLVLRKGETLGLVGESGCGKSTIGRSLVQLPSPTAGEVKLGAELLTGRADRDLRKLRHRIQMIFQDPISSLNPRRTAVEIVSEPLILAGHPDPQARALAVLAEVGVDEHMATRRPHELSGGQCQRVSIARAIVQEPEVLVCDESVAALDVSVQAQVINILERMKKDHHLSMVFISHDLAVVNNISDRVAVMYLGRLCEVAPSTAVYAHPRHHYTKLLLSSIPQPGIERDAAPPELRSRPDSNNCCLFAPRCAAATDLCRRQIPPLVEMGPDHMVACHHPLMSSSTEMKVTMHSGFVSKQAGFSILPGG